MEKKQFYKYFLSLAAVLVLQQVITLSVNLADNMMLGAYSEAALAGVAAVNQIQFVYQMVISAFGDGVSVICTQYWGKGEISPMRKIGAIALRAAVIVGVILFVAVTFFPAQALALFTTDEMIAAEGIKYLQVVKYTYLFFAMTQIMLASMRSVEKVNIAFYLSGMAFVINCSINYVLIYGRFGAPRLGVVGAAIGTLTARIVEFLVVSVYVLKNDDRLKMRIQDYLRIDYSYVKDYVRISIPLLIAGATWGINTAMQTVILGHMTSMAIAANSVASIMFLLVKSMAVGCAAATSVIIGKTIGEGNEERAKLYSKWLQQAFLVLGLVSGLVLFGIRIPILSFYKLSAGTKAMANSFLMILCVVIMFMSYQMPTNFGIIRGGGDTKYTTTLDMIAIFGVVLPTSLLAAFVLKASPQVVVVCLNLDQFFKCVPAFFKCNYGHWMKKLTR